KKARLNTRSTFALYFLFVVLIAGGLLAVVIVRDRDLSHQPAKPIIFVSRANYYKSLDLDLVRQASFSGQALSQLSYLNIKNISVWGHSMGAYIALRAAVVSSDIKNVILLSAPVGTIKDRFIQYRTISDLDNPVAIRIRNDQFSLHGNPLSNPGYWGPTDPL